MKIAIAGAGAVGGIIAWHLAKAGHAPTLVARPAAAEHLARDGLTLVDDEGAETVAVEATADAAAAGPQDLVLVGFKAQDWRAGLALVRPLLGPETTLIPLLNGVPWWFFAGMPGRFEGHRIAALDPDGALADSIPAGRILGCVVYVAAEREAPGRIRWNPRRKRFVLGEPMAPPSQRLQRVAALLEGARLIPEASSDIRQAIWMKLLGNATYNPLSVVTGATMGRLYASPVLLGMLREMMAEVLAVGRAFDVIGPIDLDERLRVPPGMDDFKTSMLQDFEAGRPLELGAIIDAVIELGALAGVQTPTLQRVSAMAAERWHTAYAAQSRMPLPKTT
jgi:2-dehydropantoate 2-reductase